MVTQYEYARAGIITEEMIYVAHRENMGRATMIEGAEDASPTAKASARKYRPSSPRNSSAARSRVAARSFRRTSIIRSWSR